MALFAQTELYSRKYFSLRFIGTEDKINLEPSDVLQQEGLKRIRNGQNQLMIGNQVIPELVATIPRSQLVSLYNEVNIGSQNYITGLRVYFACENQAAPFFKLIFQPVMLDLSHYDPNSQTHMYRISYSGLMYSFNSADNTFVANTNVSSEIDLYKKNFKIKRTSLSTTYDNWSVKDPEYILFPFQLLFELMESNKVDQVMIYSFATTNPHVIPTKEFQHSANKHLKN